jgi:hypothetical protein
MGLFWFYVPDYQRTEQWRSGQAFLARSGQTTSNIAEFLSETK